MPESTNGHANGTNGHANGQRKDRQRYARDVADKQISTDPARGVSGAPPNFGRYTLPHVLTFQSLTSNIAKVYRNPDEAIRHAPANAAIMRNDCAIMLCLEARQRASALLNWHLEPEDAKDPKQKALADGLTKIIQQIPRFIEYRRCLLEALWYGRYAVENAYGFDFAAGGKKRVVVNRWKPINGDKLLFRFDDGTGDFDPDQVGVRVHTAAGAGRALDDLIGGRRIVEVTWQGYGYFLEPWERSRIVLHKHMIEDAAFEDIFSAGAIHGIGIRSRIYWSWYQAQEAMAQLMEVVEKTGQGFTIYYFPSGNPEAEEKMRQVATEQGYSNVILIPYLQSDPDACRIEQIPANTQGLEALRNIVVEFFGRRIKQYILGQNLTTESDATGLGSGVADLHKETFSQIIRYDAANLDDTLTAELVEPLKRFNAPWASGITVRFRSDFESDETDKKLGAIKQAWDMGAEIKESDVMDMIGLSVPTADDKKLANPTMQQQQRLWEQAHGGGGDAMGGADGMGGDDGGPPLGPDGQPDLGAMFGPLAGGDDGSGEAGDDAGGEPGDDGDAYIPHEIIPESTRTRGVPPDDKWDIAAKWEEYKQRKAADAQETDRGRLSELDEDMQPWNPETHLKIAADSLDKLRGQDVFRLLDSAPPARRNSMATFIRNGRPDLSGDVHDALIDVEEAGSGDAKSMIHPIDHAALLKEANSRADELESQLEPTHEPWAEVTRQLREARQEIYSKERNSKIRSLEKKREKLQAVREDLQNKLRDVRDEGQRHVQAMQERKRERE